MASGRKSMFADGERDLFKYIKKNKYIPEFLNTLSHDHEHVVALLQAIEAGNEHAAIFWHEDCDLFLTYLIQQDLVSENAGMTVYFYLMALMQFTTVQKVREEDSDIKSSDGFIVQKLMDNNDELTTVGEMYLSHVSAKLKTIGAHQLNLVDIRKQLARLPKVERWLFKLSYAYAVVPGENNPDLNSGDRLMAFLLERERYVPHLVRYGADYSRGRYYYWAPSSSVFVTITKKISDEPVQRLPVFGSVNEATLAAMHRHNVHPYPLYSRHVKSNLRHVDGYRAGPLLNAIHDDCHIIWASMLTRQERRIVLRHAAQLDQIAAVAKKRGNAKIAAIFEDGSNALTDFDLCGRYFASAKSRFSHYLQTRFFIHVADELFALNKSDFTVAMHLIDQMILSLANNQVDVAIWTKQLETMLGDASLSQASLGYINRTIFPSQAFPVVSREPSVHVDLDYYNSTMLVKCSEATHDEIHGSAVTWKQGQTVYLVGDLVRVKEPFMKSHVISILRDTIDEHEVLNALPRSGKVKLFNNKLCAQYYANINSKGEYYSGSEYFVRPVFKVKLKQTFDVAATHVLGLFLLKTDTEEKAHIGKDNDDPFLQALAIDVDVSAVTAISGQVLVMSGSFVKKYPEVEVSHRLKACYPMVAAMGVVGLFCYYGMQAMQSQVVCDELVDNLNLK